MHANHAAGGDLCITEQRVARRLCSGELHLVVAHRPELGRLNQAERAAQKAMLRPMRKSQFVEYTDAGHVMHWEEPQRFALDLMQFVHSLAAAAIA